MGKDDICDRDSKRMKTSGKRSDAIDWEHYFMAVAFLAGHRSKDPNTQVGACIVNAENKIVSVGYNGFPKNCDDDKFPWEKSTGLENKQLYVCHAELNAILNKNSSNTTGCKIYVSLFPCNECAKCIIQAGIKEVIFKSDKKNGKIKNQAAKRMFDSAQVKYRQFTPKFSKIEIDFDKIDNSP